MISVYVEWCDASLNWTYNEFQKSTEKNNNNKNDQQTEPHDIEKIEHILNKKNREIL